MKTLALLVITVMLFIAPINRYVFAQDPYGDTAPELGTPEDNECNPGGALDGECETEWHFRCGWFLARLNAGVLPVDEFPAECYSLLSDNIGPGFSGDGNSGSSNSGESNVGFFNSGDGNTGFGNTGDGNTGLFNSGDVNTGFGNTGDGNTGLFNSGDGNTGSFNSGDGNTGFFNSGN